MKKILLLLTLPFFINSCYTAEQAAADKKKHTKAVKRTYIFSMVKPVQSSSLDFEDSTIASHFDVANDRINFSIANKSNHIIKLIWDNASLAVFGRSHQIMHGGVKFIDRGSSSPPSTILPGTQIDDLALPTDNVYYRENYYGNYYFSLPGSWRTTNLLLPVGKKKNISKQMIGQTLTLYLPIVNENDQNIGYTFEFKVTGISVLTD